MTSEQVRDLALAGICFECGAGPFKSVVIHLWQKHRIDKFALCEAAGVTMETVFMAPETREIHRQNYKTEYLANLRGGQGKEGPKRFTSAGKTTVRTNGHITKEVWIKLREERDYLKLASDALASLVRTEYPQDLSLAEIAFTWGECIGTEQIEALNLLESARESLFGNVAFIGELPVVGNDKDRAMCPDCGHPLEEHIEEEGSVHCTHSNPGVPGTGCLCFKALS